MKNNNPFKMNVYIAPDPGFPRTRFNSKINECQM